MDLASSPNGELLPGGDLRNPASEVHVVELRSVATLRGEGFEERPEVARVEGGGDSEEQTGDDVREKALGGGAREEEMGGG
ncbi:hypothetical protein V2J09_006085 [Rumex salicifolius]